MEVNKWFDNKDYKFTTNFFPLSIGKMHYIDEGSGIPIVFVHGNGGWSFEFRKVINVLSKSYRCIAPDHIGFGLSDKPTKWSSWPVEHAENFNEFINSLELDQFILVVNDWGGPIAMSYAINNPEKIKHLIITNTWMWSVDKEQRISNLARFYGSFIGSFLIINFNYFSRVVIKNNFFNKYLFNSNLYKHLRNKKERKSCYLFFKEMNNSASWLDCLWAKRSRLHTIPKTIIWGMKDTIFGERELKIWTNEMYNKTVVKFHYSGHYPYEEESDKFINEILKIKK